MAPRLAQLRGAIFVSLRCGRSAQRLAPSIINNPLTCIMARPHLSAGQEVFNIVETIMHRLQDFPPAALFDFGFIPKLFVD